FERSPRYSDCPDPALDIVDPGVVRGDYIVPQPFSRQILDDMGNVTAAYALRTPEREHYAVTDLTNPPGDWFPRRPDWWTLLVDQIFDGLNPGLKQRVITLHTVPITDGLRTLALADVPFGTWVAKDGCDLSSQPKVSDIPADARPLWMGAALPSPDDRVY